MGRVLTLLRISPSECVDIEELAGRLQKIEGANKVSVEDYVFGTKIIKASFIGESEEQQDFEEIVSKVDGVETVQVEECGLIS
ncbi:hypothetical protein COX85_00720 [Candidatus Micrarchaeota archaeon CG_4_10_14_0_2_um_filter_55_9]|nr:MAG: hypothetical protein AUJ15_04010 [Candidatus Micrarchaeota archaeon CG1_02_55_41]PIO02943.1 MAG: hypothetical protein COT57_01400 [Candidatus Micrarchaeota archaeon CG09_land_8_20_14_0_10_55_25]PIZ91998.1 MAG: hypothetical protein COX85_00720 [Candidatus Micrarchaeota archaeon CG_4_10_14_0_2_um_filter_55_9]PJD01336.1 MAG: hypothetical protein COU38_01665 [Candidatus Micrarchaeota archaeon CG10_big_fil_rev_8_21_14_0_10_54_18]